MDFASFRPLEEHSRDLPLHNAMICFTWTLSHTAPAAGAFFVSSSTSTLKQRAFERGRAFHVFVPKWPVRKIKSAIPGRADAQPGASGQRYGLPFADRSRYDEFMLYFTIGSRRR